MEYCDFFCSRRVIWSLCNCDLLKFIDNIDKYQIELYDIDPTSQSIIKRDTLNDIPEYNNKFVLTNPPYLARNKNKDKTIQNGKS